MSNKGDLGGTFFDSVSTGNTGFQESQVSETIQSAWSQEDLHEWRRRMPRHSYRSWRDTTVWELRGCPHKCRGSWLMSL